MRVAFTLEQCWHRVPGGTAIAALRTAAALVARGVDVAGVSAAHRSPPPPEWRPPVPVHPLPLPRPLLYEAWHRLRRPRVELATGPVDVVHATSIALPPKSAPLVVTIHDLLFVDEPANFTRRGVRFFGRGLELARRDADLVLCPSQTTARACERAGFDAARLRLVPMGVHVAEASPDEVAAVREAFALDRPYVLWVGTIEPRKNLAGLLEAFAMLDVDLDLVLAGPRGWGDDLDALVGARRDRVRSLGFVRPDRLGALYAGAEAFCFPSHGEGFGLPVLEAMAQGTPVVTARGTSTEEVAGDAGVLVDPADPASIAEGIERVVGDPGLAARLRSAGRARAGLYSWERTAELVARAYEEVTG